MKLLRKILYYIMVKPYELLAKLEADEARKYAEFEDEMDRLYDDAKIKIKNGTYKS